MLPGLVERHGRGIAQIMLASTVAGEAPASAIIRDLLKSDELVALPKTEEPTVTPAVESAPRRSDDEQAALRARRTEARKAEQAAARARCKQSDAARRRH